MVNKAINLYTKNFSVYHYKGWYWVIHPVSMEWVVCVSDSGYTFFCRDFWKTFFEFYPSKDLDKDIHNWVIYKLKVPMTKHCYPDYIPNDYNWKDEFGKQQIIDAINKGVLVYDK